MWWSMIFSGECRRPKLKLRFGWIALQGESVCGIWHPG